MANDSGDKLPSLPDHSFSALILSGIAEEYDPSHSQYIRKIFDEHRLLMAKEYIRDAIDFRFTRTLAPSYRQLRAQRVCRHPVYQLFLQIVAASFLVSIAFEKIRPAGHEVIQSPALIITESILVGIMFLDLGVQISATGFQTYLQSTWGRVYGVSLAIEVVSIVLGSEIRLIWLRSNRVLLLLCKFERYQPTLVAMASTFLHRRVATVLMIYTIIVSFYAIIGQVSFGRLYGNLETEFTNAFSFPEERVFGDGRGSELQHFIRSWVSLFTLTTTENYPGIAYPAIINGNKWALIYFVSFIILGIYLILNVLLAATYRSWKEEHSTQLLNTRVVRYHNLIIAWQLLLDEQGVQGGKSRMTYATWCEMIRIVKPREKEENMRAMFKFMDRDNTNSITRKEFLLHACDAMRFNFEKYYRRQALKQKDGGLICCYEHVFDDSFREGLLQLHDSYRYKFCGYCAVIIGLIPLMCRVWDTKDHLTSPLPQGLEQCFSIFAAIIFSLEQFANILLLPPFECWDMAKQIDFIICFFFVIATVIAITKGTIPYHGVSFQPSMLDRVLSSCRILLVLRFLTLSTKVKQEMATTWRVRHAIVNFLFVAVVVIYAYAMLGVSLMHGFLSPRHLYDGDPGETWTDDASVGQSLVSLNNYGNIFIALLQIGVDNNWQDILWANTLETSAPMGLRWAIGLYFVSFFVVMGWFGLNILTALVIETYDYAKAKTQEEAKKSKAEKLKKNNSEWDGAAAMGSVTAGEACECIKCGPGGCAVFVPTVYDKNLCQCGHASLYHHVKGAKGGLLDQNKFLQEGGGSGDGLEGDKMAEGFQKFTVGEQNFEVPQYEADFDVAADLEDESVLKLLEVSVAMSHLKLLRDVERMHSQFRDLLKSRGLNPTIGYSPRPFRAGGNNDGYAPVNNFRGGGGAQQQAYRQGMSKPLDEPVMYGNMHNGSGNMNNGNMMFQPSFGSDLDEVSVHFGSALSVKNKKPNKQSMSNPSGQGGNVQNRYGNGGGGGGGYGYTGDSNIDQYNGFQQQRNVYGQSSFQGHHSNLGRNLAAPSTASSSMQYNNHNNGSPPQYHGSTQGGTNFTGRPYGYAMNVKSGPSSTSGSSTRGF